MKTKKQARELGLRTYQEWIGRYTRIVPRKDAPCVEVKGEKFYRKEDCERLVSRNAARKIGRCVSESAEPINTQCCDFGGKQVRYPVFRLSDCVLVRKPEKRKEPETENPAKDAKPRSKTEIDALIEEHKNEPAKSTQQLLAEVAALKSRLDARKVTDAPRPTDKTSLREELADTSASFSGEVAS